MRALLVSGRAFVTPKIRSKTLRRDLRTYVTRGGKSGYLNVPYYWAEYYHDGHSGVVQRKKGKWLVFYKDPKDDPRIKDGYPRTKAGVKRLTAHQFYVDKAAGKLIVTKMVGPVRKVKKNPFFTEGMQGFPQVANAVVRRNLPRLIQEQMRQLGILQVTIHDNI